MLSDSKEGNHDDKIDRAKKELLDERGKRMVGRQLIAPEDQEKLVRREKVYSGERSLRQSVHAGKLTRIPSRRSCSRKKGRHAKFMLNKVIQQGEESEKEEEESRGIELCKKKILMGEKCRPLNKSGILQYDENGFLLLEEP
ncbi:hypothetical protein ACH5RR_022897 [Cinchona calisaya]|uniref:Uncharacterized protein n=1 Tax=Cinchona calisaya TaxID=153742 RepID=A0ABD2ZCE5_9GENT